MKIDRKRILFTVSALIIVILIVYLGSRAIKHEVLTRQYQATQLAKSRMNSIELTINALLEQKATHIEAVANLIEPTTANIVSLIENEIDIKNIFVISKDNQVIYPSYNPQLSESEESWFKITSLIARDVSVLTAHYLETEHSNPLHGWYLTYDSNGPVLVYWLTQQDKIMGFQISYVKLLLDLIATLDNRTLPDKFAIKDGGQLIYDNGIADNTNQIMSFLFDYPLKNWQLDYYYQDESNTLIYILGVSVLFILSLGLFTIFLYGYREYNRTARLATQQVNFVGQVSHEFKTPLTNITLYSEILKERLEDEPSPIPEYLDIIVQESLRLTRLIQNVLNFTKSSKITVKPIHLNVLLQKNCQIFKPAFNNKRMTLNFSPCCGEDLIESDEDKLIQIVNNLLSNAEKYASKGHQVDLLISRSADNFTITVRDYGDGIPTPFLSQIFKPFFRLNSSLTEGVSGTGIGLTIAKQLAMQLQGEITVKNMNPGAQFTLILPARKGDKESMT